MGSRGKPHQAAGELVFVKQIDFFTSEKIYLFLWLSAKTPRCSLMWFSTPPIPSAGRLLACAYQFSRGLKELVILNLVQDLIVDRGFLYINHTFFLRAERTSETSLGLSKTNWSWRFWRVVMVIVFWAAEFGARLAISSYFMIVEPLIIRFS